MKRSKIIENLSSLLTLQIFNYILPLLTLPYLTRVLGTEKFGLLAFAAAFIQYFVSFTDYGFNLSATRQISIHRDDPKKISEIFYAVFSVKIVFMLISFVIMATVVVLVPMMRKELVLYLICFIAVLGNVLFPVWFYQGIERMKFLALVNGLTKIGSTALIFILVKKESDYITVAILQSAAVVVAGIISLYAVRYYCKIHYCLTNRTTVARAIKDGWPIFVSLLSVSISGNTNIFVLGLLTNNQMVGYLSIAMKVVWAVANLTNPVTNAVFPQVGYLFATSRDAAVRFLKKYLFLGGATFFVASIALIVSAPLLVKIVVGANDPYIESLVRIMSAMPFIIFLNNVLGTQVMLNTGMESQYMKSYLFAAIVSFMGTIMLAMSFAAKGSAINFISTELSVLTFMVFYSIKAMRDREKAMETQLVRRNRDAVHQGIV